MAKRPIVIAYNTSWYVWNFRMPLIAALRRAGYEVLVLAPRDELLGIFLIGGLFVALAIRRVGRARDVRPLVPIETEPLDILKQLILVALFAALDIRVFDAKNELAALLARIEPVEKSCAGVADVNLTGGRGGKTYAHLAAAGILI